MSFDEIIFIVGAICVVSYILFYVVFQGYKSKADYEEGGHILRYSLGVRIFPMAFLALPVAGIIYALFIGAFKQGFDTVFAFGLLAGFIIIEVLLYIYFFKGIFRVSSEGIEKLNARGRVVFMGWQDIESLEYSKSKDTYIFKSTDGQRIRISIYLQGIVTLKGYIKANIDASKLKIEFE